MSIDALPPAPAATDPVDTFDAKAFAFNAALQLFRTQANATADTMQINADILAAVLLGMALPDYAGTSSSSFAIGTGSKVFATQTGKLWTLGQIVVISNGANLMRGPVTAYSAGNLTVNVTSISGSGTFSSWTIGLSFDGLLLAKSGANADITSLSGLTTPLSVAQGGTGSSAGAVFLTGDQTVAGVKTFSSQPVLPQAPALGTAVATTSGTAIDFTGIPAWVKQIVVPFSGVSTSGSSSLLLQLGSGSVQTSGYSGGFWYSGGGAANTAGFQLTASSATDVRNGALVLTRMGGNLWALSGNLFITGAVAHLSGGTVTLSGALDRIRLTTVGGTDTFDAGSVNIFYQG